MAASNEIIKIQRSYLEILDGFFPKLWEKYKQSASSPLEFLRGTPMSDYSSHIPIIHSGKEWNPLSLEAERLLIEISSFWKANTQTLQDVLKTSNRLNTQIGDLNGMSDYYSDAVIRLGLYFDSICLLDPLSIMAQRHKTIEGYFTGKANDPQLIFLLLNYLEIRSMESLLLSETDLPIAILIPPTEITWGDDTFKLLEQRAQDNTNQLFAEAFNKRVDSLPDLFPIFESHSLLEMEKAFRKHPVLKSLFDSYDSLDELIKTSSIQVPPIDGFSRLPVRMRNVAYINGTVQGRFLALEGAETSATNMGIDLNVPKEHWAFNRFRARRNAELLTGVGMRAEIPIQAAIMSEKMDWMAAATVDDLLQLREKGFMEQIREIYRVSRRDLQRASPEKLDEATSAVVMNVTEALKEFMNEVEQQNIRSSQTMWRSTKLFLLSGSLALASVIVPPWAALLIAAYSSFGPGKSAVDLIKEYRDNEQLWQKLANRPIAHMLEIWDRGTNRE
jgi:hypothetical protein